MKRVMIEVAGALTAAALVLTVIFLIRPINETAPIRQVAGADFSQPYLGRTIMIQTGQTLRQYFTAPRSGLIRAVGVFTPQPNRNAKGLLLFKLAKIEGKKKTVLYTSTSNIAGLANNEGLSIWRFKPLRAKKGELFAVSLTAKADPGFLVFGKSDTYEGGYATVNKERLGVDVDFEVFYSLTLAGFWRHLDRDAPSLAGPAALSLILVALWLSLAIWLRRLFFACLPGKEPPAPETVP